MSSKDRFDKSYLFLILLLIGSGAVSWNLFFKQFHQQDTVNIHQFPRAVGGWTSIDLPILEDEYLILETRNVFTRRYKNSTGQEVYLMLVYSQSNRKVSHPPEICYAGSGVSVLSDEPTYILLSTNISIRVNRLFVEHGSTAQIMYYWFKVGDAFTSNYWKQQILIVWKTLLGRPASSALIRVSATIDEGGADKATRAINEFVQVISPDILKYLP